MHKDLGKDFTQTICLNYGVLVAWIVCVTSENVTDGGAFKRQWSVVWLKYTVLRLHLSTAKLHLSVSTLPSSHHFSSVSPFTFPFSTQPRRILHDRAGPSAPFQSSYHE